MRKNRNLNSRIWWCHVGKRRFRNRCKGRFIFLFLFCICTIFHRHVYLATDVVVVVSSWPLFQNCWLWNLERYIPLPKWYLWLIICSPFILVRHFRFFETSYEVKTKSFSHSIFFQLFCNLIRDQLM